LFKVLDFKKYLKEHNPIH